LHSLPPVARLAAPACLQYKGSESDFTPLPQWEREYRLFHAVARIPAFAQYRAWKSFTVWKRAVRASAVAGGAGQAGARIRFTKRVASCPSCLCTG